VTPSSDRSRPVVVGVDWDPTSAAAVGWAADYAESSARPLLLLHATFRPTVNAPYGLAPPAQDFEEPRGTGSELLAETLQRVRAEHPGLDVEHEARAVNPIAALLTTSSQAHLIVVGRRGTGRLLRLLAGEVGTHVATHAACAVAVIRAQPPPPGSGDVILVGYDGSPASAAALDFGFSYASQRRLQLLVLHVVRSDDSDELSRAEKWLDEEISEHAVDHADVTVQSRVLRGHPIDALVEAASRAALVAVGHRGRGGFTGLRLGSAAQGLLHHTECSVVIVRSSDT
jgi:nucleotide-binding universal stress UspA family protein